MSNSPAFLDHCSELLADFGAVRARRMFGGHGLYLDDLFVALIANDTLYLKTDGTSRAQFEAAGCSPFRFSTRQGEGVLSYFNAPEAALDSSALMAPWVRLAQAAALRSRLDAAKPRTARRPPKANKAR